MSKDGHAFGRRVLTRIAVLLLCADALGFVIHSHGVSSDPVPSVPAAATVQEVQRPPGQWLVKVDGWTLGVDTVERGALARVAALLDSEEISGAFLGGFPFAEIIALQAGAARVDWRLIAALIVEESGFNPTAESPAGAYGLMQVRPIAARDVNEPHFRSPEANIRTGVRYLRRLLDLYPARDPNDQLALALAAYNMGPAHLNDAQQVAIEHGYDPLRWYDGLELVVPLLEEPGIYRRLENGFARGRETARYVDSVLRRFSQFRQQYGAAPTRAGESAPSG